MNKKNKYELLAPAGSLEKAKYALNFGADAVYLGVPDFSLRTRINSFTEKDIEEIIKYAHQKNKKVYITVNIYAHNRHLKKIPFYLKKIKKWQADGVILSDPGILRLVKKYLPNISIHLSTQANTTNYEAAKFWYENGVERIILAREVTLKEIQEIHRQVPKLELEYFVHGAMCMSYSGRCLLSSFFLGRSANLGDCVQPCRWRYNLKKKKIINDDEEFFITEEKRPDMPLKMEEDIHGTYIMNSKDLCLVKYLRELQKAGVSSFKIEGRAKSIYYVSLLSLLYKQALLSQKKGSEYKKEVNKIYKELQMLTHRGYTTGFLFGADKVEQKTDGAHILGKYQFVGEVIDCQPRKNKKFNLFLKVHNSLFVGERITIIEPSGKRVNLKIKEIKEFDGTLKNEAHGGQNKKIIIPVNKKITAMSIVRKKTK